MDLERNSREELDATEEDFRTFRLHEDFTLLRKDLGSAE